VNLETAKMNPDKTHLPIILLAGPTGVGKTALSIELAERLGTEIVNADSMQVYRHMDIGTAKPTAEERSRIRHHLLDVVDPDEPFYAARYLELARPVVDSLHRQGKIPIVVGGTGLYMKILTRGICSGAPTDPAIREQLLAEAERYGLSWMHEELLRVDPELGSQIHPNDLQRIVRTLEVHRSSGKPLSYWQLKHRFEQILYRSVKIFLTRSREELYERIDRRVHMMIDNGFVDEVRRLLELGYGPQLKPMQSLGYRQLVRVLKGEDSLAGAVTQIQRETRRYAKRQFTWFRGDPEFRWFDADAGKRVLDWIERSASCGQREGPGSD